MHVDPGKFKSIIIENKNSKYQDKNYKPQVLNIGSKAMYSQESVELLSIQNQIN